MAEIIYEHPIQEIKGALSKHGVISRRKVFRDERGTVIHEGKTEAYAVRNPRDFEKTPPTGNELAHHNRWKQACQQAFADLHDDAKRAEWQARFDAQLHHATEDTPTNPKTGQRKHYYRLDAFVRAVIYAQLKASN